MLSNSGLSRLTAFNSLSIVLKTMGAVDHSHLCRLKREDCKRTKHGSVFSDWKILIGPSDWKNHSLGKEGAERYRIQNLPPGISPGLYELGIAVTHTGLGRDVSKLVPDRIIVVYLGQADNIRSRLQHYGRQGAHLENNGYYNSQLDDCKDFCSKRGSGLFEEIFSRGFPIVFRWAPMKNKRDAEQTEARLLDIFDYAWNKGNNGSRRPTDILKNLDHETSTPYTRINRKVQIWKWENPFRQKKLGIEIKTINNSHENINFLPQILKFGRSRPRLVSDRFALDRDSTIICGIPLSEDSFCRKPPIKGRRRCEEHKGITINGSNQKIVFKEKSRYIDSTADCPIKEESFPICGVYLIDGSTCKRQAVQGRKRCEEHKGMRIQSQVSSETSGSKQKFIKVEIDPICGVYMVDGYTCKRQPVQGRKRCEEHKGMRVTSITPTQLVSERSDFHESFYNKCGAPLWNGSVCKRNPVPGRKRCEQHKGMRAANSYY